MSYNFNEDSELLSRARRFEEAEQARLYTTILEMRDQNSLPLYNFHALSIKRPELFGQDYPLAKTPRQNIIDFFAQFDNLFKRSRFFDYHLTNNDIELAGAEIIKELFDEFAESVQNQTNNDFEQLIEYLKMWVVITSEIIRDIYVENTSANNAFGKPEFTFFFYTGLMATIDSCYEDFVENLTYGSYYPASKFILYNFWGDEYSWKVSQIKSDVVKNTEEQAMTEMFFNKDLFACKVRDILLKSILSVISKDSAPAHDYNKDLRELIQNQFSEYTKMLRRNNILVRDTLLFAASHWYSTTGNILVRETNNQLERVRLSIYEPGDIIHPNVFKTSLVGKAKIELLQQLQQSSLDWLKMIYDNYTNKLKNGELMYEWAGDIDAIQINYNKLWKAIIGKYIYDIGPDVLEDAIRCADLSSVQSHVINPDINDGALMALVQQIGKYADSWWVAVAASLKNTKGAPHTKQSIQKLKMTSIASLDMIGIIDSCIPRCVSKKNKS